MQLSSIIQYPGSPNRQLFEFRIHYILFFFWGGGYNQHFQVTSLDQNMM